MTYYLAVIHTVEVFAHTLTAVGRLPSALKSLVVIRYNEPSSEVYKKHFAVVRLVKCFTDIMKHDDILVQK